MAADQRIDLLEEQMQLRRAETSVRSEYTRCLFCLLSNQMLRFSFIVLFCLRIGGERCVEQGRTVSVAGPVSSLSFTSNGALLAVLIDRSNKLLVFEMPTAAHKFLWDVPIGVSTNLAFNAEGSRLACVCTDVSVRLFDATLGRQVGNLPCQSHPRCVAWSPDGKHVATGDDKGEVCIWHPTCASIAKFGTGSFVHSLCFSRHGAVLAVGCADGSVHLFDAKSAGWPLLHAFPADGSRKPCRCVQFSPVNDCLLAACLLSGDVVLWDITTPQQPKLTRTLQDPSPCSGNGCFNGDGTHFASTSKDNTVKVWDVATGQLLSTLSQHTGPVNTIAFHPLSDDILVSGSDDKTLRFWLL